MLAEKTGIGIPREAQEFIFNRFRQVDESTTRNYGGTGLGLSICKGLIELMGGRITVDSEPGVGSTFRFALPCRPVSAAHENTDEDSNTDEDTSTK
jgi:signal transduction histidine kinase